MMQEKTHLDRVVLGGKGFTAFASCPPDAAQVSHVQLWNLAASGKNLLVDAIYVSPGAAADVYIASSTTILLNAVAAASKKLGGAASAAAQSQFENRGSTGTTISLFAMPATFQRITFDFGGPIVVPPGTGLVVKIPAGNTAVRAMFDFREVPI